MGEELGEAGREPEETIQKQQLDKRQDKKEFQVNGARSLGSTVIVSTVKATANF